MTRVAIYLRLSTLEQTTANQSLELRMQPVASATLSASLSIARRVRRAILPLQ
jgi:hypothetical protein